MGCELTLGLLWLLVGDGVVVYRGGTQAAPLFVVDDGDQRSLRFGDPDADDQTAISLSQRASVPTEYVRDAFVATAFTPTLEHVLMIGLGGGSFSARVHQSQPNTLIDVVEINAEVVQVAERFFGVRPDARLRIHVADGRQFLERTPARYDLILVDAYSGEGIPTHLTDRAFFALVRAHLNPQGVALFNIALLENAAEQNLVRTLRQSFVGLACLHTQVDDNLLVVALATPLPTHQALQAALRQRAQALALPWDLPAAGPRVELPCR